VFTAIEGASTSNGKGAPRIKSRVISSLRGTVPNKRTIVIGAALAGAVLAGMLIWDWNRPGTSGLRHANPGDVPQASLKLLSPGIVSVALESRQTGATSAAVQADGTIVVGAWASPLVRTAPASNKDRALVLRLAPDGRLAHPAVTQLAGTPSMVRSLSITKDGTTVVVGYGQPAEQASQGPVTDRRWLLARFQPNGAFDPGFAGGAAMLANLRSGWLAGGVADAVATEDDGSVIVTGMAGYSINFFGQGAYCATARFSRDGHLDRSFGDDGRVLTLFQTKTRCTAAAVIVSPDKGFTVVGNVSSELGPHDIVAFRYLASGAPDPQFGRDGARILEEDAGVASAAPDSKGRIVTIGSKHDRFLVARYDSQGKADPSFGEGRPVSPLDTDANGSLSAMALQADGKIVAVGTIRSPRGRNSQGPGERHRIAVVRLNENGTLDESFATGGVLEIASPRYGWDAHGVTIQPDGKLLMAGKVVDDEDTKTSSIVLVRLNPDGTPDKDFGSGL
jgi:uncharacterized delta-60 repeat protein